MNYVHLYKLLAKKEIGLYNSGQLFVNSLVQWNVQGISKNFHR